ISESVNFCVMEAIKLCRLDTPIIFIEARINLSRFVVTGCAAKTSATVTFPSLNLISLFAFCFNIWLNGVASYPSLVSWVKHSVDRFVIVSIFIPKLRLILILNSFLGSSDSLVFSELFHSLAPRPLAARSISDFLLITLADDRLEAFYDNPNALRDYFRDIGRMVLAAEGRKANDSHADCYQYFCVPEYGTANGRLHFHAVHFMRTLPTGSVDPNFGRRVRNRRQLNSLQNTWPYGYS